MTTPHSPELFTLLETCWACAGAALTPSHTERIAPGGVADQPGDADILGPYVGCQFILNRCGWCGFLQPHGIPTHPRYFEALYNQQWSDEWIASEFNNPYKEYIFRTVLQRLGSLVPGPRRALLDVGAHVGRMVHLAVLAGWDASGLELNPKTAAFAARKTGRPVHRCDAAALADAGDRYDAVVLTDVLEHIPDPVRVLAGLRRLVRPGGWVAVKVPHGPNQRRKQVARSWLVRSTEVGIATSMVHINHFTDPALRAAFSRAGFDRVEVTVGAPELEYDPGRWRSRAFRLGVFHAARLIPWGTHTPLALNLQAYARNPG